MGIASLVPSISSRARILIYLTHIRIPTHHRPDRLGHLIGLPLTRRVRSASSIRASGGGEFKLPVISNDWPCNSPPYLYGSTLPFLPTGHPTTTSPSRISCFALGAPPPMPTISPMRIDSDERSMSFATMAAEAIPYRPLGKYATTMW